MSEKQLSTTVTCNICNKTMKCITRTHLAQHGHTIETYQATFPEAAITNEAELHRRATKFRALNNENKGKKRDPEIGRRVSETKQKNKRPAWNKGLKKTPEERAAQSVRVKQQYDSGERVGSNLGKKMSEETKQKLRESTLSIQASRSDEEKQKIREKKRCTIEKRRESGWVSPNMGRKVSPEQLSRSREILAQNKIKRTKMSHESCTTIANERGFDVIEFSKNVTPRTVQLKCRVCGDTTNRTTQYLNNCKKDKLFCRTCVPSMSGSSIKEQELCDYIKSIVPRASVISNDRVMLEGKEIDILIPDLKLGFEFNGLYWHSETVYQKHIHHALHKTLFAYNKGIRLITVFEDEWDSKQDIVKSRIAHILNQNKTLCYARECEVGMVDFKTCGEFLEEKPHSRTRSI